jgi:hypothetical protein
MIVTMLTIAATIGSFHFFSTLKYIYANAIVNTST